MANAFAALTDVEEMIGSIDESDADKVNGWLRRASALIRLHAAGIDLRIAQNIIPESVVADITVDMVIRVLRNEEGVTQETIGPSSVTFDPQVAAGRLFLTPDELLQLQPPAAARATVGTIRTVPTLAPRRRFLTGSTDIDAWRPPPFL